jgi:hypothetical protein
MKERRETEEGCSDCSSDEAAGCSEVLVTKALQEGRGTDAPTVLAEGDSPRNAS